MNYDEYGFGLSWTLDEPMQRTSHALLVEGRVWLVDPVGAGEAIERATALGPPAGVFQLLDRHPRDCRALAARFGVPHVKLPDLVADAPFEVIRPIDMPGWRERTLWWPERHVLVVAEVVGSNEYYTAGGSGTVGMHPFLRAVVPGALRGYEPEHLLMGHGAGVHGPQAAAELERAHHRARRDIPRLLSRAPRLLRGLTP